MEQVGRQRPKCVKPARLCRGGFFFVCAAEPDARPFAVLLDEDYAGRFKGGANGCEGALSGSTFFKFNSRNGAFGGSRLIGKFLP